MVALLIESMVKAMFLKELKMAAILIIAIAGSGLGLALVVRGLPRSDAEQSSAREKPKLVGDAGANPGADIVMPIRSLLGHTEGGWFS